MPSSDPARRYRDILDYIEAIFDDVVGLRYDDFAGDRKTYQSVIYSLQCISEAAKKLGYHAEEHAPDEDWPNIRGFGNIARHDYGEIDLPTVWDIVESGLPPLKQSCRKVLQSLEARSSLRDDGPDQDP